MTAIEVIVALIVGVVGAAAGYFVGYNNRKKTAEAQIGSAEAEATRLVNEAMPRRQRPTRRSNSAVLRSAVRKTALTRRKMPWTARPKPWSARKRT